MNNNDKNPYMAQAFKWSKPQNVKEWVIKKLKEGDSPKKITCEIKKLFKLNVALATIYRWRDKYTSVTGERIAPWIKLNPTLEQRKQHGYNEIKYKEIK